MVPPPVDPASVTPPAEPLPRLALGGAWRLRAFGHALAHGLRRVPGGEHHLAVLRRIESALRGSDAFLAHPSLSAGDDPERLVQARLRLEPLPNCESWAEVATADALMGRALDLQVAALRDSSDASLAEAARHATPAAPFGARVLTELCADARNRQCVQILVDRWLAFPAHVFGKPGTAADDALAGAGVRPRSAEALGAFVTEVESSLWDLGLEFTDPAFLGIIVPEGWAPRHRSRPQRRRE